MSFKEKCTKPRCANTIHTLDVKKSVFFMISVFPVTCINYYVCTMIAVGWSCMHISHVFVILVCVHTNVRSLQHYNIPLRTVSICLYLKHTHTLTRTLTLDTHTHTHTHTYTNTLYTHAHTHLHLTYTDTVHTHTRTRTHTHTHVMVHARIHTNS